MLRFKLSKRSASISFMLLTLMLLLASSVDAKQFVTIERINVTSIGQQAGGGQRPVVSGNGRFVAFWSDSNILVPGDANNAPDIFVRDRQTNQLKIASVASGGTTQANALSFAEIDISTGGNLVVFASDASNLVANDTNGVTDVFIYDVGVNQTARVSLANGGVQANGRSYRPVISGNGLLVAFRSEATNLVPNDNNNQADIFIYDRVVNQIAQVNLSSGGAQSNSEDSTSGIAINEDGKFVAFESRGSNLVTGDTNGAADIFVRDRATGKTIRVSVSSNGGQGNGASTLPSISANGRYVAFMSSASNLVADDSNNASDVFIHDRDTDNDGIFDEEGQTSTVRVSVSSDGAQANGSSTAPSISGDGRYITFWSAATNLVNNDTNGVGDIFLHDTKLGITTRVSVGRNGEQANGFSAFFSSISNDARFVAFESLATNIVPNDTNGAGDIFLAQAGPSAPTELVAQGISTSQINLTWKDNANDETRYIVERSSNNGQTWTVIAPNLPPNTKSYSDTSLGTCDDFSYRVFAQNAVAKSLPSNVATASTLGCPPGAFNLLNPTPGSYVINPANLNKLTWSASTEADTFAIQLERTVGEVEVLVDTTVTAAAACVDTVCSYTVDDTLKAELVNGVYSWSVVATNEIGDTEASNSPATFEVDDTQPPRAFSLLNPVSGSLIRSTTNFNDFTWDNNLDAATYNFLLLKGSNNPQIRALGIVRDLNGLTPEADADALACTDATCTFTIDETLEGELTTGTYMWTVIAVSPGGGEKEAVNAPFLFSINTEDIELLTNTSFEIDANGDKIPDGWTGKKLTGDKRKCNKDGKVVSLTGECAFGFKGNANEGSRLQQKPDVSALGLTTGDVLTLTAFVQGKKHTANGGVIQIKVVYENSGLSPDKVKLIPAAGTYAYDDLSSSLTIDGAVASIKVVLAYSGKSGKMNVDDVTLTLKGQGAVRQSSGDSALTDTRGEVLPLPMPQTEDEALSGLTGSN